jgi:hypothetical protein
MSKLQLQALRCLATILLSLRDKNHSLTDCHWLKKNLLPSELFLWSFGVPREETEGDRVES